MERRRRTQATGAVFRSMGPDGRGDHRGTQAAVLDFVFVRRFASGHGVWSAPMPMNATYRGPIDLPGVIPVFPLPGALLLPRGQMPLNIFEAGYLAMVDDSLRDGHRLIGMIQPDDASI